MELLVAALVPAVVEGVKRFLGTNTWGTHIVLLAISFAAAAIYVALVSAGLWETVLKVAVEAAGIWAVVNGTTKELKNPT